MYTLYIYSCHITEWNRLEKLKLSGDEIFYPQVVKLVNAELNMCHRLHIFKNMISFFLPPSTVTIPIAIRCLERNLNMDQQVTRVILPIVATLTMDGIALYEPVAAIFIAQVHNMDLDAAQIIIIRYD